MEKLLVSIIIPTYNAFKFVEETVNSCLNQTYENIEIIIQDDCSIDGTWELVNNLYALNRKIKLYRNEENLGIGGNWNAAYKNSKGTFLIIFNADDLIIPSFINESLELIQSDDTIDIVTGRFEILYSETGKTLPYPGQVGLHGGIVESLFVQLYFKLAFHWNYSLVKRSLLEKVRLSNGDLFVNTQVCDLELWYRCFLANAKVFFNDKKVFGYYRKHDFNNSSKPNGELKSFLKDFLYYHQRSFKKLRGYSYTMLLTRRLFMFCKAGKNFDLEIFYLFIKRIAQSLI